MLHINYTCKIRGKISGSLKFRDLKIPVESKDLGHIVAKSLMKQYHNRKMIDVSNFYYNLHMAWRGVRTFFWRKMLKFFCSPLAREAKIGRKLKKQLLEKHNIEEQLDSVESEDTAIRRKTHQKKTKKATKSVTKNLPKKIVMKK